MDTATAVKMVDALANGIDPITGEVLPEKSPYNNPEIIRALFCVINNLKSPRKPKKTTEERQQENLSKGLPKNYGLPWRDDAINLVISEFNKGTDIQSIAQLTARKTTSIISLLKKHDVISEVEAIAMGLKYAR